MAALSALLLASGCAGDATGSDPDAGGPPTDSGVEPAYTLELLSDPSLPLAFGEEGFFAVRYLDDRGSPITGATVGLALVGRAHDSSLDALEATTDAEGIATGNVLAGRVAAAFRVRLTAERAVPVHVDVAVSDVGFGGLRVMVSYDGERSIAERAVDVYAGASCTEDRTFHDPGDRTKVLPEGEIEARFVALPAGISYAVVARGRGPSGEMLAWGCTDGVAVEVDAEADALVSMRDLDLVVDGTYSVEVQLSADAPLGTMAAEVGTAGATAIADAGGDGAFVLDALESMLRDSGSVTAADDLAAQRDELDPSLALRFETEGVGPSVAVDSLAALVEARAEVVALTGTLAVADAVPAWTMSAVSTIAGDPDAARLAVDLGALGVEPTADLGATWLLEEDAMQLDELRVGLPLGSVGLGVLAALADERRVDGTAGLMLASAGCGVFQAWAAEQPVIAGACDDACVLMACKDALERAAAPVEAALMSLDAERSVVTVAGRVELTDTEGDRRVDSLLGESLGGLWSPPDGTGGDAIEASLSGARMIE